MCGIVGFLGGPALDRGELCKRMAAELAHRGPDDFGVWHDDASGVVLGHRRLSILDLSPAGHQPMHSRSGRLVIVFNGEIYNHLEIRRELLRVCNAMEWRGHSDTETLLAAIEEWGLPGALARCVGMFAFAVWDRSRRSLYLARDRIGEKPLYYGRQVATFLFASELKALRIHPQFSGEIDRGSLALYLRHNYVPDPRSIFTGINKLPPGTWVEIPESGNACEPVEFWSAARAVAQGQAGQFTGDDDAALSQLERTLGDAVEAQMVADVPLGAFLSGGVDSSLIVALMQSRASRRVRTFTIGFENPAYDEAPHARAVATHLKTDHTELIVTAGEALSVIPRLPTMYDEPFADSSQIPTALVSSLARKHVTVSLSGDGGDELFGGYTRYALADRIWKFAHVIPRPLRQLIARVLRARSPDEWDVFLGRTRRSLGGRLNFSHGGEKVHKLAGLLASSVRGEVYRSLVSHWPDPSGVMIGTSEPRSRLADLIAAPEGMGFEQCMMYWDLLTYLPGDILVKVDRAAMSASLETRVPMLDHRVVEFAWTLPMHMRIRSGKSKWLLRQLLYKHVPQKLIERPKMGFGVPIDEWLRGPLRSWAETLLDGCRLKADGFFEPSLIRAKWSEHIAGRGNWAYPLWDILMFQAWLDAQRR